MFKVNLPVKAEEIARMFKSLTHEQVISVLKRHFCKTENATDDQLLVQLKSLRQSVAAKKSSVVTPTNNSRQPVKPQPVTLVKRQQMIKPNPIAAEKKAAPAHSTFASEMRAIRERKNRAVEKLITSFKKLKK